MKIFAHSEGLASLAISLTGRREGLGGVTGPGLERRGLRNIRGYYRAGRLEGPGQAEWTPLISPDPSRYFALIG